MPDLTAIRPAPPFAEAKTRIAEAVESTKDEILELSHRIHANPEPAFEEYQASAWVAEILARHGFTVEYPAGSLATAIRATRRGGRGGGGPRVGILAEYDALPGLATGAGTTRWRRRESVPRSRSQRSPMSSPARSSSSGRLPRSGGVASRS